MSKMGALFERVRSKYHLNSSRVHLERVVKQAAASVPPRSRILDAGAGSCRYAPFFSGMTYEPADFGQVDKSYGSLTYVCDLRSIPVEDNRYDLVLLTQVLEHLSEPKDVLRELHRVLKPGHQIWLTQPFYYEEHEQPYDFYRYTQFGLKHLLNEVGFEIKEMFWLEGYLGTLGYQLDLACRHLPTNRHAYGGGWVGGATAVGMMLVKLTFLPLSLLFSRLDRRHKHVSSGHCKNYVVVAVKL